MTPPRRDPYLWIHLAGLATLPLWLDICLAGLAVGDPVVSPGLELITLGLVGTLPILWMQLQRPFYIFSVPGFALRPDQLSVERRRLLSLQRTLVSRLLVILSAIALLFGLYWLYQLAPITADMTPFAAKSRTTGWAIAAISFVCANLFVQVPVTVIPLLLASPTTCQNTEPFESAAILKKFMVVGLRLESILPDLIPAEGSPVSETAPSTTSAPAATAMSTSESAVTEAAPSSPSPPESLDETTAPTSSPVDTPPTSDDASTIAVETADLLDDESETDTLSAAAIADAGFSDLSPSESANEIMMPTPSLADTSTTSDEPSMTAMGAADFLDDESETDPLSTSSHLQSLTDAQDDSQFDLAETAADESASTLIPDTLPSLPDPPLADEPEAVPASSDSESLAQDITVDSPVEPDAGPDAEDPEDPEDHAFGSAGILEISDLSTVGDRSEQSRVENDDSVMPADTTASDEIDRHAPPDTRTASSTDDAKASVFSQES